MAEADRVDGATRQTRRPQTGLIGAAGEYYVAAELSRRGWLATVTVKNAPGTDVLAKQCESGRTLSIQTKTTTGSRSFLLSEKDGDSRAGSQYEWYVLVRLPAALADKPEYYVVPREEVARLCRERGDRIRERVERGGKDHGMRTISRRDLAAWKGAWDLLETPTGELSRGAATQDEEESP